MQLFTPNNQRTPHEELEHQVLRRLGFPKGCNTVFDFCSSPSVYISIGILVITEPLEGADFFDLRRFKSRGVVKAYQEISKDPNMEKPYYAVVFRSFRESSPLLVFHDLIDSPAFVAIRRPYLVMYDDDNHLRRYGVSPFNDLKEVLHLIGGLDTPEEQ